MSKYLDLDDVVAGNPVAEQELSQLRGENKLLQEKLNYALDDRERAQRTEAECQRMREAMEDIACNRSNAPDLLAQQVLHDTERGAHHTPEQTAEYGEITESDGDMGLPGMWEAADFVGGPDDTPEQEHEDALAALDSLQAAWYGSQRDRRIDTIRQALTDSSVQEEVRRLPEELRALIAQQVWGAAKDAFEISAQKVEAALASAPADANNANVTCECERGPREIVENTDEGGTKWWTLATHCTDCLESASAPTDGGNDNG